MTHERTDEDELDLLVALEYAYNHGEDDYRPTLDRLIARLAEAEDNRTALAQEVINQAERANAAEQEWDEARADLADAEQVVSKAWGAYEGARAENDRLRAALGESSPDHELGVRCADCGFHSPRTPGDQR
jgi:chromosome segregation ATPase